MLLAVLLVMLVVFQIFEMEGQRKIERVVGDQAMLGGSGFADKAVDEAGDFLELDQLIFEQGALFGGDFLFEPEEDGVDHGVISG